MRVNANLASGTRSQDLPEHEMAQVVGIEVVLPLQVLLKIVLSGPVLWLILTRTQTTTIDCHVSCADLVDASLMSVEVVVGAEPLDGLYAVWNGTFVGLIVPSLMFPGHSVSAEGQDLRGVPELTSTPILS